MTYQQVIYLPFGHSQAEFKLNVDPSYYATGYKLNILWILSMVMLKSDITMI